MKKLLVICLMTIAFCANSQEKVATDSIYSFDTVDVKPEFEGGVNKFYKFVGKNFKPPEDRNANGKILIGFIIEVNGSLSNLKILKAMGYGADEEALRVLAISPNWIPAVKDGKAVRCEFQLPILVQVAN